MDAVDIDTIDDEDVLKQMWQVTEDFAEKRRIRARMYKLREKRLKDFYTSDDVMTAGSPSAASLPSQSATSSYNCSTTSAAKTITTTSSSAMETDESDGINSQQKRRNDANQEEDAVSEKIRRKSSVRTKRYQMVLAASGGDAESSEISNMETSSTSEQRAMSPDSLTGSQLIQSVDEQKSLKNIRPDELSISVLSDSSYQELKSSSHRREFQEGDILTIQEVTETWRRIRESGQSNPVTQRVTLTKTIRQRVSDGAVLEENEDEVIDDIDDDTQGSGSGGITAVDAALRRSSIIAITTTNDVGVVEENVTVAKKKFETGVIDDAVSEPDSLDNSLPEPDNVDNHSLADSLELNQTTTSSFTTSMTTQKHQSTNRESLIRMDSDVSNQSVGEANLEEQVEQLIVPESKPSTTTNSATRTKRTPSESPSRGATAPAKKRADSAELRRQTTATSTGTGSRTGLGGINRNTYSSSTTTTSSNKSSAKSSPATSPMKSSSSIPRLTSTPISAQKGKKPAAAESPAADDSVTEFLQLEKEIQSEKVEDSSVKTTGIKRPVVSSNSRPSTPISSRKTAEPVSTRSTTSSRVTSVSSTADKKGMAKKVETTSRSSTTTTTTTARKELASPSSSKPGSSIGRPTMIRTVETTRTITVRDRDEDKPWRVNSSTSSSSSNNRSKGISGIGRPARKDLHNNVMSVVEKYVDTEGCALHGSHPHIHDDDDGHHHHNHGHSPSPPPPAPEDQKPEEEEEEEEEPVAPPPQTNGVADEADDLPAAAAAQEEETPVEEEEVVRPPREENLLQRPKKLSVTTTMPMEGAVESATSPLNKSGSRLSIASPVLGSPSVVKKARSLFHSDSFDGSSETPKSVAEPTVTGGTASISKIRSSFESSSSSTTTNTSTIKRENTKLWEPQGRINKLDRPSLVKDVVVPAEPSNMSSKSPSSSIVRNSNSSGLFSKSRSPSPAKEIATPTAPVAMSPRQPDTTTPAVVSPADVITPIQSSGQANQVIEEIEDLTLLENMLNTATNYDDRSRIRAHIRTVKKKLGLSISSPMPQRKSTSVTTAPKPAEPAVNRNKLPDFKKKDSTVQPQMVAEPKKEVAEQPPPPQQQPEPFKVAQQILENVEMSSSVYSTTSEVTEETTSESVSRKTSLTQQTKVRKISQPYDSRSETKEFVPRVTEEQPTVTVADGGQDQQVNGDVNTPASDQEGSETGSPKLSRAPWRRQSSEANMIKTPTHLPEPESNPETLDITSSYGTGPMDENGRPLFGLGALRRRPTKPLNLPGAPEEGQPPQPIIIERSQTLTELQKLHESQTVQQQPKGELEPVEKPRAKLRDTFTNSMDTESDGDRAEPIISERSQALREIIRIHEQQVSSAEATAVEVPPPSPTRPKAKLKDSFVAPIDSPDEPDQHSMEQMIERSESFQTIIKRHQELSTSQTPTGPLASPPMKRPGILKKPKDWSSPSPQEVPSPVKEDQVTSSMTTSSRKTSVEVTTMESTGNRKASIESSIEIQLNPVQSSSIVVTEIPASGLMDRRSSGVATTYSTIQYNSVQDVKMDNRRGSQQPRKFSIDVEPSPMTHTSSVTLPTTGNPSAPGSRVVAPPAPFVLSGDTTGHSIRSTSTFQLQQQSNSSSSFSSTGRNTSTVVAPALAPIPTGDDPTPWRRKSIPREPSIPRDTEVAAAVASAPITAEIPPAQPQQPVQSRVSMAKLSMNHEAAPPPVQTSNYNASPLPLRSNRISSSSTSANESTTTTTTTTTTSSPFQRTGSINNRYRPSQPENNAPFGSGGEPKVKTLPATGASVRALAQKFLITGEEKSQPQVSKTAAYPKAGLIFRSNSFRSQNNADGTGSMGLVRSESLRISPARSRVSMDRQSQERSMDENGTSSRRESSNTFVSSTERRTSSYNQSSTSTVNEPSAVAVAAPIETLTLTTTTTSKSFLQDRTPVRGMQDIIGRMRAGDAGSGANSSEDERSLSLLNKLIGAQILVQCTEQAASSAGVTVTGDNKTNPQGSVQSFTSSTEERSADGTRLSRTQQGTSFESGQDEDSGTSWTRRSSSTAKFQTTRTSTTGTGSGHPTLLSITSDDHIGNGVAGGIGIGTGMAQTSTSIPGTAAGSSSSSSASRASASVIDGIDINTCTDDFKLNELLDNCNDYETRRQIRARIKTLLTDVKGPTDMIQRSSNNAFGSSTVQSKTEVTTTRQSNFSRSGQPGQSAFSKFQQLDQSIKSSTSGGPMQGLMGGGLSRSASGIKDFLLQWCQSRTRGYKNVQIENFSSSWNDGLAFCALIHHFYPDAFDYNQLEAKNKRYNFTLAFKTADEKAGIAPLLDVEDMVLMARPDWKCVFTYVQSFYRRFKDE